jgi:hypothetical protein
MGSLKINQSVELDFLINTVSKGAAKTIAAKVSEALPEKYKAEKSGNLEEISEILIGEKIRESLNLLSNMLFSKPAELSKQVDKFLKEISGNLTRTIFSYFPIPESLNNLPLPGRLRNIALRAVAYKSLEEGINKALSSILNLLIGLLKTSGIINEEDLALLKQPMLQPATR